MRKRILPVALLAVALSTIHDAPALADSGAQKVRRLVGTWSVRNETTDPNYAGEAATGQVTFAEDQTLTLDGGGLAAAGLVHRSVKPSICNRPLDPISFKFLGTGAKQKLYVTWTSTPRKATTPLRPQNAVIDVIKLNDREAIMVGQGGCGEISSPRISHLTRIDAE